MRPKLRRPKTPRGNAWETAPRAADARVRAGINVNKDPRLSVASVSIPYGQRFITIDIEDQNKILFVAPGNLFLKVTTIESTSAGVGAGGPNALAVQDVKKYTTLTPVLATGSTIDSTQSISVMELYTNNIFVNPEIHDIFIKRIGFSLIRVHRYQSNRVTNNADNILLSQLKWPTEYLQVGIRPAYNIDSSNPNQYRDWHRLTLLTDNIVNESCTSQVEFTTDDSVQWSDVTDPSHKTNTSIYSDKRWVYPTSTPTIDTLQLQAHSIPIYQQYKAAFYRDYIPYTFGGANLLTPDDPGAHMLNFCLYPGTYQPSGHINVSRAREFYLGYTSSYLSANTPGDLLTVASAINFMLISDGSAVLRYST